MKLCGTKVTPRIGALFAIAFCVSSPRNVRRNYAKRSNLIDDRTAIRERFAICNGASMFGYMMRSQEGYEVSEFVWEEMQQASEEKNASSGKESLGSPAAGSSPDASRQPAA